MNRHQMEIVSHTKCHKSLTIDDNPASHRFQQNGRQRDFAMVQVTDHDGYAYSCVRCAGQSCSFFAFHYAAGALVL